MVLVLVIHLLITDYHCCKNLPMQSQYIESLSAISWNGINSVGNRNNYYITGLLRIY